MFLLHRDNLLITLQKHYREDISCYIYLDIENLQVAFFWHVFYANVKKYVGLFS